MNCVFSSSQRITGKSSDGGRPIKHYISFAHFPPSRSHENRPKRADFRSGNSPDPFADRGRGFRAEKSADAPCGFGVVLSVLKSGFRFRKRDFAPVCDGAQKPNRQTTKTEKHENQVLLRCGYLKFLRRSSIISSSAVFKLCYIMEKTIFSNSLYRFFFFFFFSSSVIFLPSLRL